MVKSIYNYGPEISVELGPNPPPPPLPHYDPNEEAPKWDWYRIYNHFPLYEKHPDLPKRVGQVAKSDDKPDWRGVIKDNVVPLPKVTPYNFPPPQNPRYFFFDTPDYADPFKKLWYSLKWFSITGGIIVSFTGIMQNRACNYRENRYLFGRFFVPWVAGGMVFSAAAITIANLRGNKDDLKNYVAAGLVAGAATGRKNYVVHLRHTLFWTLAGPYAKYNAEINGNMAMRVNPSVQSFGTSGLNAEGGFFTGNWHWYTSHPQGDPGRDVKGFTI